MICYIATEAKRVISLGNKQIMGNKEGESFRTPLPLVVSLAERLDESIPFFRTLCDLEITPVETKQVVRIVDVLSATLLVTLVGNILSTDSDYVIH